MRALMLFAVTLIVQPIEAQTGNIDAKADVSYTLPLTGTPNNAPLTGANALTENRVWLKTTPILDTDTSAPTATLAAGATTYSATLNVPNGSTIYARVKSCNANGCSPFGVQASKTVTVVVPNAPTNINVSVTVTVTSGP